VTRGPIKAVQPAPHEFDANLIAPSLKPWFAADRRIKDGDGSVDSSFSCGGRWTVNLSYHPGNLLPPESGETPAGTTIAFETIREPRLKVERHPEEDPTGEQGFYVHMAPRWQGMQGETADGETVEIGVPDTLQEGVNCRIQGSNIRFGRYQDLLCNALGSLGITSRPLQDPHPTSNVQDAELYVRLGRDESGPIHARDGPLAELGHLLESDRSGYRKVVQNDQDGRGEVLPGYYHTTTLGPDRVREAWPNHRVPKEIKHYYAREAASKPKDDPLAHPKLGASYQASRWDDSLGWGEIDQLERELEETVLSVLHDAGLPIRPKSDGSPFVQDAYFAAETTVHEDNPVTVLNLSTIRSTQESVVIRHVSDGLSPVEWESLETLVTDGGEVSPTDIATEHERHPGSVRRALRRLDELVEREYNRVSLRSNYVAELVHEAVESAREQTRRAVEAAGKALEAADRELDETTSALVAWAARHDVQLTHADEVEVDFGTIAADTPAEARRQIRRALRAGRGLWAEANQDPSAFITGRYRAVLEVDRYPGTNYLTETDTQAIAGRIGPELARQ